MVRTLDAFWTYVEDMNDGNCKKCKFCGHIYGSGTSVSRVKYHLSGLRRAGVKICEMVPANVREAARAAIDGPPEKTHKTTASSSNNEADNITIPAPLPEQNSEAENGMADHSPGTLEWFRMQIGEIEFHDEGISPGELLDNTTTGIMQHGVETELGGMQTHPQLPTTLQTTDPEGPVADDGLMNDEENITREPEQNVVGDGFREGLQHAIGDEARGDVFPTPKVIGGEFEENKKVIWSWLMNNEVSLIGLYGMGGVGKTTLMKLIYNQLRNKPDKYRNVYWITVSQDFSIYKLQNLIANRIDLDLSNEDDEMHRATILSRELGGRQNYVLILDDLWNHFEPEEMGIPSKMDGCKLIITTRSLDVCRRMGCIGNVIKVQPLRKEEAWNLFKMELRNYDIKLEHLAKSVAGECDGLPLGVRTMARSMRGVYDEGEWRNALAELQESRVRPRDMEPEVFRILRYSFLHLNDSNLKQCFLYCALFPEDFEIHEEELIELLIVEGIIEGRKSRQAEFDKGHEMLNRLKNACLLESDGVKRVARMHDLVRDMALQQMRENSHVMVEAGQQLEELPDEEDWSVDLVRVSLMENAIKGIPSIYSLRCPNLSTLLLCKNIKLKFISDSFFKQMQSLKVLDLSHTAIQELPDSISDLVTLNALLLQCCSRLTRVPSLAKLKALKKLDLYATRLREMPQGLGLLCSLKYLDINHTCIQEFPAGILPKLCHLQVLRLRSLSFLERPVKVKADELACLRKLETLECYFDNLLAFKKYLKELDLDKKEMQQPRIYKFLIGRMEDKSNHDFYLLLDYSERVIYLYGQEINKRCGDAWVLPKGIEKLAIEECSEMKSLCDFYPSQHETELKHLEIVNCPSMECLVSFKQMSKSMLGTIEVLLLMDLGELHSLYSKKGAAPTSLLPSNGIFSHLKILQITFCPTLETLFPPDLLPNLQNLEKIIVRCCSNLEKIISSSNDLAIEFNLPKLRYLQFFALPALTSFGCEKLVCNSLLELSIDRCGKLKRLPFSWSTQTWKYIKVWPKIWWESVEWDLKNTFLETTLGRPSVIRPALMSRDAIWWLKIHDLQEQGSRPFSHVLSYAAERHKQEYWHFTSTGTCKYGSDCKYHHLKERIAQLAGTTMGPLGLPLRPGKTACKSYTSKGFCMFGPYCNFDHPFPRCPHNYCLGLSS